MRILVACDSFKESCTATAACQSIADGLEQYCQDWDISICPLADGGEGTVDALASSVPMIRECKTVSGPLGEPVTVEVAWTEGALLPVPSDSGEAAQHEGNRVAWIESASCLGLALVQEPRRNPLLASSYGLGQLIDHARRQGAASVIVGLGGSATVDAGIGMAQAVGVQFPGIRTPAGGRDLELVTSIVFPNMLSRAKRPFVLVATDVDSPLLGPFGAARVFGPQKGATPEMVEMLERGIEHYARQLFEACSRALGPSRVGPIGFDEAISKPGAGAAGGIGFALQQLFMASTTSGVDLVMRCVNFEERLEHADYVVTGEGRLDSSSFAGKVVSGVLARARRHRIPVAVVCGVNTLDPIEWGTRGIAHVQTLLELTHSEHDARRHAPELLVEAS